jgi:hypothetical protein
MRIGSRNFDLEERAAAFVEGVIRFARTIPESSVTRPLLSHLARTRTRTGGLDVQVRETGGCEEEA